MHILIAMLYVSAYLLCYAEVISGNGSVFRPMKLKFDTSVSLSCRGISCVKELDAIGSTQNLCKPGPPETKMRLNPLG